jgi:hypothetical protein
VIENDKQLQVTKDQVSTLRRGLNSVGKGYKWGPRPSEQVADEMIRNGYKSQIEELESEIREYEQRKGQENG